MRGTWAQVSGALLLLSVLLGASMADGALAEPSLLIGAVGALLLAWGAARPAVPPALPAGVAVAAREHRRALARLAAPRQRDPDAPGHTRSRAPSGLLPAAGPTG
ncbi:DUF6412 domain-containing protein [Pseudonocardia sp.]|uniref:DUF6412 domain-containing protein n=1 Tax=Pseudonocardia sp. TaxID=60912 RepID=UPI0026135F28|nr:DUF6412 domain-containing protein [Pseudonocardia sp.]